MSLAIEPTLSDLLPESLEGLGKEIQTLAGKPGFAVGWRFVETQALAGLRSTLKHVDLCQELARAWVTIKTLHGYKALPAGETAVVPLGEHRLSLTAHPTLKLRIGGVNLPDLKLTYGVAAEFDRATLSIRDGALVAVAPGDGAFTAKLSCGEVPLHPPCTLAHFPLPAEREFAPGFKLP
jgi:hypothetical protein